MLAISCILNEVELFWIFKDASLIWRGWKCLEYLHMITFNIKLGIVPMFHNIPRLIQRHRQTSRFPQLKLQPQIKQKFHKKRFTNAAGSETPKIFAKCCFPVDLKRTQTKYKAHNFKNVLLIQNPTNFMLRHEMVVFVVGRWVENSFLPPFQFTFCALQLRLKIL